MSAFEDFYEFVKNIHEQGFDVYLDGMKSSLTRFGDRKGITAPIPLYEKLFKESDAQIIKENNVPIKIKFNKAPDGIKEIKYKSEDINIEYKCKVIVTDLIWNKNNKDLPNIIIAEIVVKPEQIFNESGLEEDVLNYIKETHKAKLLKTPSIRKAKNTIIEIDHKIGTAYNLNLIK